MNHQQGQSVRIIAQCCGYYDRTATIAAVVPGQDHPCRIDTLEPWALWFGDNELTPALEAAA